MALKTNTFLRRAERDDLDTVVEWMEDPDFVQFLYGDLSRSPKQVREQIVGMLGRSLGNSMPAGVYLIIDSKEYGPIGLVSLQNISWRNRSSSVDVYIGRKDLRRSFVAAVAFYRAAEYCFDELNLHRISAYIYSFNSASWRLMERTGAKRELVLKDHVARDGQFYDMYCYGLLHHEFEALRDSLKNTFKGVELSSMIEQQEQKGAAESEP
jgi:RimJ/RimL family protein N-acetyltransferase